MEHEIKRLCCLNNYKSIMHCTLDDLENNCPTVFQYYSQNIKAFNSSQITVREFEISISYTLEEVVENIWGREGLECLKS